MNASSRVPGKVGACFLQHLLPPTADVDGRTQLQKSLGHALAQPGAPTGDQDALALQQVRAKHVGSPGLTDYSRHAILACAEAG